MTEQQIVYEITEKQFIAHDENSTSQVIEFYRAALRNAYGLLIRDLDMEKHDPWEVYQSVDVDMSELSRDVLDLIE